MSVLRLARSPRPGLLGNDGQGLGNGADVAALGGAPDDRSATFGRSEDEVNGPDVLRCEPTPDKRIGSREDFFEFIEVRVGRLDWSGAAGHVARVGYSATSSLSARQARCSAFTGADGPWALPGDPVLRADRRHLVGYRYSL